MKKSAINQYKSRQRRLRWLAVSRGAAAIAGAALVLTVAAIKSA